MAAKIALLSLMATAGGALSLSPTERLSVHRRALDDPSLAYLASMCVPNYFEAYNNMDISFDDFIPSLHDSPLPCEQETYIMYTCLANDTTEIDFLAEQQCVCGSNFRSAYEGCNECYQVHGYSEGIEEAVSIISSIWSAECSARPTKAFTEYWFSTAPGAYESQQLSPTTTLGNDKFPNNTAVSNYWTGLPSASLGSITGSATARATEYVYPDEETTSTSSATSSSRSTSRRANFSFTSTTSLLNITSSTSSSAVSSGSITSAPTSSTPVTAVSQAPSTTSTSTNGVGMEMGSAWNSGVALVVVNVVVIAFL
ncbi:hypothetical protein BKA65DRAFT_520951 [Rhexocercosporidium sp. MPI-PUGE-AT-0058]|nr:hypothetical protein BKA65DRAFT_520951 [Rhexocercosporidium sp. MPI-PUGE-AT-0058]